MPRRLVQFLRRVDEVCLRHTLPDPLVDPGSPDFGHDLALVIAAAR
jgi:hypothetical protein